MIYLIRIICFICLLANTTIAQQTGGPFQFNLKVNRINLNRTDCFSDDIDFNKPKKFELTIYDNSIKQYFNTRKINIYEPPIGFLNNCDNHPELIPFIKHFVFQILPLEYNQKHKVLKIKINYAIDELTNIQSNKKQNIKRSYQTVQRNVPLGKPFNLTEISSVDSLHNNVSIEIFNKDVKTPQQINDEKIAQFIPAELLKIDNSHLPPIHWRILHLVTDRKIDKKYWLDERVAWAQMNKAWGKNFNYQTLTSKAEYFHPEQHRQGNIELTTIFIPQKVNEKKIDFTFLLIKKEPETNKNSTLSFKKNLSIKSDEPLEVEVEFPPSSVYRFFFYITAYLDEDLKAKYGKK